MNKDTYIQMLKKESILTQKHLSSLRISVLSLFDIKDLSAQRVYLYSLITQGITMIERGEKEVAAEYFLALSELPKTINPLNSFCVDAMLVAEDDFHGEFISLNHLKEEFARLRLKE